MAVWLTKRMNEIAELNPHETIKKGTIAKKISMDKLQPFCRLESKKFCTTKKPGDPSKFLTYPAASELFALSANLAVFP